VNTVLKWIRDGKRIDEEVHKLPAVMIGGRYWIWWQDWVDFCELLVKPQEPTQCELPSENTVDG
jgi:hypothetical protein